MKPYLIENGLFFVGIDVIDGKLTEINVTSPTGIIQINSLNKMRVEKKLWGKIENELRGPLIKLSKDTLERLKKAMACHGLLASK